MCGVGVCGVGGVCYVWGGCCVGVVTVHSCPCHVMSLGARPPPPAPPWGLCETRRGGEVHLSRVRTRGQGLLRDRLEPRHLVGCRWGLDERSGPETSSHSCGPSLLLHRQKQDKTPDRSSALETEKRVRARRGRGFRAAVPGAAVLSASGRQFGC